MTIPLTKPWNSSHESEPVDLSKFSAPDYDKVLAWVKTEHSRAKNARTTIERQWYVNLAFYFGKHYVQWATVPASSGGGFKLSVPKAPPWRVRSVTNKIRPMIRTELSKLTSQKPTVFVLPASADDEDINAARAGELVWESIYSRKKFHRVLRDSLFWTLTCGTGYIKTYWDESVYDPNTPVAPTGQQIPGDIVFEDETPFHVYVPDLREQDIENQPYLFHAMAKSPEWVSMRYREGLNGKKVQPNVTSHNQILDAAFLNLVGAAGESKNSVLCVEAWVKPGMLRMFPNGALITLVGDHIVGLIDGSPYGHNEYPFSKIDHLPSGKYYGDSVIEDLIPLQKEYNRTRSQIIEAKNLMGKPQLMYQRGSIDPRRITSEPGQAIAVTPGFPMPTVMPMAQLPGYILQELDRIQMDFNDISGQHEVTRGQTPPGVTAATAIQYLAEQYEGKLSHTVDSIEQAVEKCGRQTLSLVGTYWDLSRTVKVAGKEHLFDAEILSGADLHGNTDIRVEAGSALPTSKAAKQAFIMDLMKMGFVDPQKGLSVLELGGIDKLYESIEIDQRQAQRENIRMQAGQPVAVNTWDEHAVHIVTHNRFRKSQAFEKLPDEIKALFEEHVNMHLSVIATGQAPPSDNPMGSEGISQPGPPTITGQENQQGTEGF